MEDAREGFVAMTWIKRVARAGEPSPYFHKRRSISLTCNVEFS